MIEASAGSYATTTASSLQVRFQLAKFYITINAEILLLGVILGLCAFDYGYDYLVVGQVLGMPSFTISFSHTLGPKGPVLTATDLSILSAVPISGAIFGALITGIISDRFGRKVSLYVGYGLGLLGSAIQTGGVNIAMFTIGRWIVSKS